jgi:chromosome segregation ATPase
VAAAAAVESEATTRTTLETAKRSTKDRATTAQAAAATAMTERDTLATRLDQAEAEIERLRTASMTANEAAERATTSAAAAEATSQDAAQTAAQEKAALEANVADLKRDLATAEVDLVAANRQFSEVTTQLQVVSEEAMQLREDNSKLSQDLYGEPDRPFFSQLLLHACSLFVLTCLLAAGSRACRGQIGTGQEHLTRVGGGPQGEH